MMGEVAATAFALAVAEVRDRMTDGKPLHEIEDRLDLRENQEPETKPE